MKALALLALLAGCTQRTDLFAVDGGHDDAGPACTGTGAPIVLGASACSGAAAASQLRYALCSCLPLSLPNALFAEASAPDTMQMHPTAAIGVDGSLDVDGPVQLMGPLTVGGAPGMSLSGPASVDGTLRSAGEVTTTQYLGAAQDVYANGSVNGLVQITGTLHLPDGDYVDPLVKEAAIVREVVDVVPPCACDGAPIVDAEAETKQRAQHNDNATIALAADAFTGEAPPAALDLPCGEYYLSSLTAAAAELDVEVHGRAALFVDGDVTLPRGMRVVLDSGAELDLVVRGNLALEDGVLGSMPGAAFRVWIGGDAVSIGDGARLGAAIYAPHALVTSADALDIDGAIFARGYDVSGDLSAHYETSILAQGSVCGVADQPPVE